MSNSQKALATITRDPKDAYGQSVASLRCLTDGNHEVKRFPARNDKPETTLYEQTVFVVGGPQVIAFKKACYKTEDTMRAGCYLLSSEALRVGQYGRLEIDTRPPLVYLRPMTDGERAYCEPLQTDLEDFI
jgi:hypothetical protein